MSGSKSIWQGKTNKFFFDMYGVRTGCTHRSYGHAMQCFFSYDPSQVIRSFSFKLSCLGGCHGQR